MGEAGWVDWKKAWATCLGLTQKRRGLLGCLRETG